MIKTLKMLVLSLLTLILMDVIVCFVLDWAKQNNKFDSVVQYFEYGRSVPGKHDIWANNPNARGNLFNTAWRTDILTESERQHQNESPDIGPVIRSYGMSFVQHIIGEAVDIDPNLKWDSHAGPGAPPNFTYSVFEDDRKNRNQGDIVVLGILSSSTPAMAALSNSTWAFEQPAPLTYPIYYIEEGTQLKRVEPSIDSAKLQKTVLADSKRLSEWHSELSNNDLFYSPITFSLPQIDISPLMRLLRRTMAKSHVSKMKAKVLEGDVYPYKPVLQTMIHNFAETARKDKQFPVVMLIQTRGHSEPNLLNIFKPILEKENIPYLATEEFVSTMDVSAFLPDGHYTKEVDHNFGKQFIEIIKARN